MKTIPNPVNAPARLGFSFLAACLLLASPPVSAQDEVLIDDGTIGSPSTLNPNVSTTGTWSYRTEAQHSGTWQDTGSRFSSSGSIEYSSSLPTAGQWALEIWVTDTLNADNSSVSFTTSGGTLSPTIHQASMRNGNTYTAASDQWLSLGHYNFDAGANSYILNANGTNQNSDAVRWRRLDADPSAVTPVVTAVAGGISPDFYAETGTGWINSGNKNGVYGRPNRLSDTEGDMAVFTAPVESFLYEVQLTYVPDSGRSQSALVEVLDANNVTHQFRVDQTVAPTDAFALGVDWLSLGNFELNASSSVSVIADADALSTGTFVVSDGVRFIAAIPEPGTLALVGIALGALLLFRRRKS